MSEPITIQAGFFPEPGVPFENEKQRDLAVAMHNAGFMKVEISNRHGGWFNQPNYGGKAGPMEYRLAPPEPIKEVFEESCEVIGGAWSSMTSIYMQARNLSVEHHNKRFRFVARGELTEITGEQA